MTSWSKTGQSEKGFLAFRHVLKGAQRGEVEALRTLSRHFLPGLFVYIAIRVPDRAVAEQLTSHVFLQLTESLTHKKIQEETQMTLWLFDMAQIAVSGYFHQRKMLRERENSPQHQETKTEAKDIKHAEEAEAWERVVQATNTLTEEQRRALVGYLLHGEDIQATAHLLGKKLNVVKALQFQALDHLQQLLATQPVEEKRSECRRKRTP